MLTVLPATIPQIVSNSNTPAVYHADFIAVTSAKPAKVGEVLILQANGLGPTAPGANPGEPFSANAALVNSPLQVSVNGRPAEVLNAIGWPGLVDTYRIDIRVPEGTRSGTAQVRLTVAWIPGLPISIPVD